MRIFRTSPQRERGEEPSLGAGAGQDRWILILASFAALMSSLDLNIVRLALTGHVGAISGRIQHGFLGPVIYILVLTCLLLVFGRLGDMWGYRWLFIAGLGCSPLLRLQRHLAPTIAVLLIARAVQAVGGAAMLALTTPIVSTFLPPAEHGRAIGIVAGWESLGIALGRFLGGVIVEYLDWRWIFLINLPVGLAAIAVSLRVLPEGRDEEADRGFDFGGAVLFALFLAPLLFALNMGEKLGWLSSAIQGTFTVAGHWIGRVRDRGTASASPAPGPVAFRPCQPGFDFHHFVHQVLHRIGPVFPGAVLSDAGAGNVGRPGRAPARGPGGGADGGQPDYRPAHAPAGVPAGSASPAWW